MNESNGFSVHLIYMYDGVFNAFWWIFNKSACYVRSKIIALLGTKPNLRVKKSTQEN